MTMLMLMMAMTLPPPPSPDDDDNHADSDDDNDDNDGGDDDGCLRNVPENASLQPPRPTLPSAFARIADTDIWPMQCKVTATEAKFQMFLT